MKKRRIVILALAVVAVLGGVIWWAVASRAPAVPNLVYDGHPVSYWVDEGADLDSDFIDHFEFQPSHVSLDSNAVPYLVQVLKARDGALRMAYERFWPRFPAWLKRRVPVPVSGELARLNCCLLLFRLGPAARPAIPELVHVLRTDNYALIRSNAASALGNIANGQDKSVIEALLAAATKDVQGGVKLSAGEALWHLNPEAAANAGVTNTISDLWPTTNSAGAVR